MKIVRLLWMNNSKLMWAHLSLKEFAKKILKTCLRRPLNSSADRSSIFVVKSNHVIVDIIGNLSLFKDNSNEAMAADYATTSRLTHPLKRWAGNPQSHSIYSRSKFSKFLNRPIISSVPFFSWTSRRHVVNLFIIERHVVLELFMNQLRNSVRDFNKVSQLRSAHIDTKGDYKVALWISTEANAAKSNHSNQPSPTNFSFSDSAASLHKSPTGSSGNHAFSTVMIYFSLFHDIYYFVISWSQWTDLKTTSNHNPYPVPTVLLA